jgi:hypothetical protein
VEDREAPEVSFVSLAVAGQRVWVVDHEVVFGFEVELSRIVLAIEDAAMEHAGAGFEHTADNVFAPVESS